jgi:glycosidase
MKTPLLTVSLLLLFCFPVLLHAQIIYTEPTFPTAGESVTIFFDATEGTGGLADCNCDVYVHTGVITTASNGPSDWQNTVTTWGEANEDWKMEPVAGEDNLYSYDITPTIQDFYSIANGADILELAFVFRNGDGTLEGKDEGAADIFYPVFPEDMELTALFVNPTNSSLTVDIGAMIEIRAASSEPADLLLYDNGDLIASSLNSELLEHTINVTEAGTHTVEIQALSGLQSSSDVFQYVIPLDIPDAPLPPGIEPGITLQGDTAMVLALYAPNKENVFVLGSFNDYLLNTDYQMTNTPDGTTWWIVIEDLEPGSDVLFQYLVDGEIRIADPYSTLILDPANDAFIPEETYPNLPEYPMGNATGFLSLVQPGAEEYVWQTTDYERPDMHELTVYELLVRDFIERHDYTTLIDTLDYLQNLGINAIELMPINEFEGNISWGYNPSYHMALDKYYGPINEFKRFIDACHERGIAVIVDVVYNHAFGQSPLTQLYFDGKPTLENPWLNRDATHPFNVGYDFNHESEATQFFVKKVMEYWISEFRLDGFRYDLSKGFTQVENPDNVGAWGAYDASRIAILKDYADHVWSVDPDFYVILEHFAASTEEKELTEYGMMVWGNRHGAYTNAAKGIATSLTGISYQNSGFEDPRIIHYMESHDEERIMYSALNSGNTTNPWHNIQELATALRRIELNSAFFYTVPGPKMLWQFGEQGYDINIDFNGRTGPKPILWEYLEENERRRLYDVTRSLINLRHTYDIFTTEDYTIRLSAGNPFNKVKSIHLNSDTMNVTVLGNFHYFDYTMDPNFQHEGTWYEYFSGDSIEVTDVNEMLFVTPGEYRLYTDVKLPAPPMGYIITTDTYEVPVAGLEWQVYPNPTSNIALIDYQLDRSSDVLIEVYDVSGKRVQDFYPGKQGAGFYQWETGDFAQPGTYWVVLLINGVPNIKTLVVSP